MTSEPTKGDGDLATVEKGVEKCVSSSRFRLGERWLTRENTGRFLLWGCQWQCPSVFLRLMSCKHSQMQVLPIHFPFVWWSTHLVQFYVCLTLCHLPWRSIFIAFKVWVQLHSSVQMLGTSLYKCQEDLNICNIKNLGAGTRAFEREYICVMCRFNIESLLVWSHWNCYGSSCSFWCSWAFLRPKWLEGNLTLAPWCDHLVLAANDFNIRQWSALIRVSCLSVLATWNCDLLPGHKVGKPFFFNFIWDCWLQIVLGFWFWPELLLQVMWAPSVCVCVCSHICILGFRLHHRCAQAMLGVLSTMLPLPRCSSFQNLFVNYVSWLSQFQFAIYFDRRCLRGDGCIGPMYGQIVSKKLCPEPLGLIDPICHFF